MDVNSLSHTKWNCKYHIVFAPKYRRKVFYEEKRLEIVKNIKVLCKWKDVNTITAEVCQNHVHRFLKYIYLLIFYLIYHNQIFHQLIDQ